MITVVVTMVTTNAWWDRAWWDQDLAKLSLLQACDDTRPTSCSYARYGSFSYSLVASEAVAWHHLDVHQKLSRQHLCIQVLKSTAVRNCANGLAYKNPALATDDAMKIGRLHTFLPGQLLLDSQLSSDHASDSYSYLRQILLPCCYSSECCNQRCRRLLSNGCLKITD